MKTTSNHSSQPTEETPIEFRTCESSRRHAETQCRQDVETSRVYLVSKKELTLLSKENLKPGTIVYAKQLETTPGGKHTEDLEVYLSKVKECHGSSSDAETSDFSCSLENLEQGAIIAQSNLSCDMCGASIAAAHVHKIKDYNYLCQDCFMSYGLLEENCKTDLRRFLAGNVV